MYKACMQVTAFPYVLYLRYFGGLEAAVTLLSVLSQVGLEYEYCLRRSVDMEGRREVVEDVQ